MSRRIVFLDRASLAANVRQPHCEATYIEHATTAPEEIVGRVQGATVAITNKVPLRADTLRQLPELRLIAVAATGYDVIDVARCSQCATPGWPRGTPAAPRPPTATAATSAHNWWRAREKSDPPAWSPGRRRASATGSGNRLPSAGSSATAHRPARPAVPAEQARCPCETSWHSSVYGLARGASLCRPCRNLGNQPPSPAHRSSYLLCLPAFSHWHPPCCPAFCSHAQDHAARSSQPIAFPFGRQAGRSVGFRAAPMLANRHFHHPGPRHRARPRRSR